MQKEFFTRAEVKALLTEAVKRVRNRTQPPRKADTHGNGEHDAITTGNDVGGSTPG